MPHRQHVPTQENSPSHYERNGIAEAILAALTAAGKDLDKLVPADLAPVDEFHVRGRKATLELAELLDLSSGDSLLDLGCGIGGAARVLASRYGCRVTGLDLTAEYCRTARILTDRLNLDSLVDFCCGDATELPFPDGSFSVCWSQHLAMNIPHKEKLYAEVHRVLRPGGLFALYDVLAGPAGPPHFPVPWARSPEWSYLVTPEELRTVLDGTGFLPVSWRDVTESGRAWFRDFAKKLGSQQAASPLGIHLLLGPEFPVMARNQVVNLEENRTMLVECIVRRRLT